MAGMQPAPRQASSCASCKHTLSERVKFSREMCSFHVAHLTYFFKARYLLRKPSITATKEHVKRIRHEARTGDPAAPRSHGAATAADTAPAHENEDGFLHELLATADDTINNGQDGREFSRACRWQCRRQPRAVRSPREEPQPGRTAARRREQLRASNRFCWRHCRGDRPAPGFRGAALQLPSLRCSRYCRCRVATQLQRQLMRLRPHAALLEAL